MHEFLGPGLRGAMDDMRALSPASFRPTARPILRPEPVIRATFRSSCPSVTMFESGRIRLYGAVFDTELRLLRRNRHSGRIEALRIDLLVVRVEALDQLRAAAATRRIDHLDWVPVQSECRKLEHVASCV